MATRRDRMKKRTRRIVIAAVSAAVVIAVLLTLIFVRPFGLDIFNTAKETPAPTEAGMAPLTPEIEETPEETPAPTPTPDAMAAFNSAGQYQRSLYEAVIDIDPDSMTVSGRLRLTYVSPYDDPLYSLELNIYPNAMAYTSFTVNNVTLNGTDVYYYGYNGMATLVIPFARELYKGESAVVFIDYSIKLPETFDRFGYGDNAIMLGQAIPIASLYEVGEWRRDTYMALGDCFTNEIADYKAIVSLPEDWMLASGGTVTEKVTENGVTTYNIDAPQVRELALAAQKKPKVYSVISSGGVEVTSFGRNDAEAQFGANTALAALELYSSKIGAYPYKALNVVQFGASGGMEYPGLIMVGDFLFETKYRDLGEYVIAHEVAHQWWYAVVGSDAVRAPWLDESLTEFMSLEYFRFLKPDEYQAQYETATAPLSGYTRTVRLDGTLADFHYSQEDYEATVYAYGAYMYTRLMDKIGEEAFYEALSDYYNEYRFKTADKAGLIAAFENASGQKLEAWFENMLKAE